MAEIAVAVAASHAPGLAGWIDKAGPESREAVEHAYGQLGEEIRRAEVDALIMIANDHIANRDVLNYPDFVVGLAGQHSGPDEWFKDWLNVPDYEMPGHPEIAGALYRGLSKREFRVFGERENMKFDDNISVPVTATGFASMGIPLVPIMQNCTVPPVPDEQKSYQFGKLLADVIREDLPEDVRVGLFGSGGLSHEPGGPRYFQIDDEFDRWFLGLLDEGDHEKILREATLERMEKAGGGGTGELLSWMVVMGAIGERDCEVLCYEAVSEWRCGVGAVRWSLRPSAVPAG